MLIKIFSRLLFGWVALLPNYPAAFAQAGNPGCSLVTEGLAVAETIRGLKAKRPVPCRLHQKAEVKAHLIDLIESEIPAEKLASEELVLKGIGLLPPEFRYKEGLIDLYVSQLGGYYDPVRKHFVMAAWMPDFVQRPIVVHELTHALQDQYFDLQRFIPNRTATSDALLARSAVAEGDATAVMVDHGRQQAGQGPLSKAEGVEFIIAQNVIGMAMMPGLEEVPEALKAMLIFPYTSGLRFGHSLLKKGGYRAIDEAFRSPPRSTEEILHPELYGRDKPDFLTLNDHEALPFGPSGGVVEYGDTIGQFLIAATLGALSGDKALATTAAAGWGGDRVTLVRHPTAAARTLVWRTNWDSPEDAVEFLRLYRTILESKGWREANIHAGASPREVVFVRLIKEGGGKRGSVR